MINEQEGLYTLYLRGSENGKKVDDKRVISSVANCLNPYEKADYDKMMEVAASDDLQIIVPTQLRLVSSMIHPVRRMTAHRQASRES